MMLTLQDEEIYKMDIENLQKELERLQKLESFFTDLSPNEKQKELTLESEMEEIVESIGYNTILRNDDSYFNDENIDVRLLAHSGNIHSEPEDEKDVIKV